jgi:hypothetical protein
VTILVACAWSAWLAFHTRTAALSTVFGLLVLLFWLAVLGDYGLRTWVEEERWDSLALHLMPLMAVYAAGGVGVQRARPWFARPTFIAAALVLIASLELLALNGKTIEYLGISLTAFQPATVGDKTLLATVTAMSVNGILFYLVALAIERTGSEAMQPAALLLFVVSPFAALAPVGWLVKTDEYSQAYDWCYMALALTAAILSHQRQRRSFYYAGVLNASVASWVIADHREWFDDPAWAIALILTGLGILAIGFWLARRERALARPGGPA